MSLTSLPSFAYSAPTQIWFAPDGLARLASYLRRLGVARALLVCDAHVAGAGLGERVVAAADTRVVSTWSGVLADAPRDAVHAGAEEARRIEADAVIAVGGGSAIDSGKAIALLARHGGDVARWDGAHKVGGPGLPLIAVPTTAGTGSEATNIAVVKDVERGRKLVVIDRAVFPTVAILDPRLTIDLPASITAATGVDALTHAVEGLVSRLKNPICDAIGLECVRLVRDWLPRAVSTPADLDARGWMLLAASMAGQLVSTTFSGVCHSVAHALGVGWGVHHGTANAAALAWTIRYNAEHPASAAAYARAAAAFGGARSDDDRETALRFADAIEAFVASLGLPTRLTAVGLEAAELPRLADLAFADPSHTTNPVKVESARALEKSLAPLV